MARPHIEPYVELNDPYRRFDIAGFKGSHYKVLSLDTDTGACTLKVRFDGGYKRKPGLSSITISPSARSILWTISSTAGTKNSRPESGLTTKTSLAGRSITSLTRPICSPVVE